MATTNLSNLYSGDICIQTGNGVPNHTAPKYSMYTDLNTGIVHQNTTGVALWIPIDYTWQPPPLTLGDLVTNGASLYTNTGAGYQLSFDAGSNDEALLGFHLGNRGRAYDGSSLKFCFHYQMFSSSPVGKNIKIEIDYAFVKTDGSQNGEILVSGTISDTIDIDLLLADKAYKYESSALVGVAGADHLQITFRRLSLGVGSDSYNNAFDVYAIKPIKV